MWKRGRKTYDEKFDDIMMYSKKSTSHVKTSEDLRAYIEEYDYQHKMTPRFLDKLEKTTSWVTFLIDKQKGTPKTLPLPENKQSLIARYKSEGRKYYHNGEIYYTIDKRGRGRDLNGRYIKKSVMGGAE
jgi:hypothetical protein